MMNDEYWVILVLLAIYLSECIYFPPVQASLFQISTWRNWSVLVPPSPATAWYRLVVESPFPQLGVALLAEPAPPLLSPSGVYYSAGPPAAQVLHHLNFADAEPFRAIEASIVSGAIATSANASSPISVYRTATAQHAEDFSSLFARIQASDVSKREALITNAFRKLLSTRRPTSRWKAYRKACAFLFPVSWALFGSLVALLAMLWTFRFPFLIVWPLSIFAVSLIPHTAYVFYRIHRMFYKQNATERRKQMILLFLTPPACIRVSYLLARELFAGSHSLAVARVVLDEAASRDFTARTLRELTYPLNPGPANSQSEDLAWATNKWKSAVWEWTEQEFGNPRRLLKPPKRTTPDCIRYCPRCLAQYVLAKEACSDCSGVALQRF